MSATMGAVNTFEAVTKEPNHRARVHYVDGYFTFVVVDETKSILMDDKGNLAASGVDRELPDLGRLTRISTQPVRGKGLS